MINTTKIKALMILKGIDRYQLAKELGIAYVTINKKLNQKTQFKDNEIKKLSEVLGVTVSELYNE